MKTFVNRTVLQKNHFKEINRQIFLKTPLYIALYVLCVAFIGVSLYDYFFLNVLNLSRMIPFILALAAMVFIYISTVRSQYRQNFLGDEPTVFDFKVDSRGIAVKTSGGATALLQYGMIYKTFESKNCFGIRCRDNSFFILRKDGFLKGDAREFSKLLKDIKDGSDPIFAIEEETALPDTRNE